MRHILKIDLGSNQAEHCSEQSIDQEDLEMVDAGDIDIYAWNDTAKAFERCTVSEGRDTNEGVLSPVWSRI